MMDRSTTVTIDITCELDKEYFGEWEELSPEIKQFWEISPDTTHCDGTGVISSLCEGCPFCGSFDEDNPQP